MLIEAIPQVVQQLHQQQKLTQDNKKRPPYLAWPMPSEAKNIHLHSSPGKRKLDLVIASIFQVKYSSTKDI